ncbi:MAG TPA: hypothetical protein VK359_01730 [Rubrobacteraceae bacterium]|nr:hypothetical protein [Rubrobacteraceae bacterium]
MSALLDTTSIKASGSRSVVSFEQPAHEGYAGWSRYLTLDGEKAYFIGGACDTCAFVFERMGGASRNISPGEAANGLRRGLSKIEDAPISTISEFVPGGSYRVNLLQLSPTLVTPGTELDYFAHEQAALWGTDAFWGLPHHPKTEYYRAASIPLGGSRRLFEFVVPMFPKGWLSKKTLTSYADRLSNSERPTALAVSVLDVRGPTTREEGPEVTEHWCLSHYLLDGHHKTYAASQAEKPITLLSFLATAESMATEENVEQVLGALSSQAEPSRTVR